MPSSATLKFNQQKFAIDMYAYRTGQEYSREEFAKVTGAGEHVISSIETRGINPSVENFVNICKIMEKDLDQYFN